MKAWKDLAGTTPCEEGDTVARMSPTTWEEVLAEAEALRAKHKQPMIFNASPILSSIDPADVQRLIDAHMEELHRMLGVDRGEPRDLKITGPIDQTPNREWYDHVEKGIDDRCP